MTAKKTGQNRTPKSGSLFVSKQAKIEAEDAIKMMEILDIKIDKYQEKQLKRWIARIYKKGYLDGRIYQLSK